jgi:hypothetical protein
MCASVVIARPLEMSNRTCAPKPCCNPGNSSISVQSLSHRLRRLEVVGGTSDSAVHKVVQAITGGNGCYLQPVAGLHQRIFKL